MEPHQVWDFSDKNKVYIVGDIHGEFEKLTTSLQEHGFDSDHDVLISVGDLVDRGPYSPAALDWIQHPWFYRVMGNHEWFVLQYQLGAITQYDAERWGGQWYTTLPDDRLRVAARDLTQCPIAATIKTPNGYTVGITHADCPNDWKLMIDRLSYTHYWAKAMMETCIFSRSQIDSILAHQKGGYVFDPTSCTVTGVDFVFHGHTPLLTPITMSNRSWIDTGACYGGLLTVVNVDDWISSHLR